MTTDFYEYTIELTAEEQTALAEVIASVKKRIEKEVPELYPDKVAKNPAHIDRCYKSFTVDSIRSATFSLCNMLTDNKLI